MDASADSGQPADPARFPVSFTWGAATASYQIEGAVHEDGRAESIWDRFSHTPGKTANGDTGDIACDHYHRWADDVALMREIGLGAYRFSVAWPRILPGGRGRVNEPGLVFYDRLVDALLGAGIEPWVTLYHWDLPQTLEDAGGWPNVATADAFVELADVVSRRLGDRVTRWITLNEPWCSAFLGYYLGLHAPGRRDLGDALAATHTLLLAHGRAVPVLRRNCPRAQVGITLNPTHVYPASQEPAAPAGGVSPPPPPPGAARPEDRAAAARQDGFMNRWFLDPLSSRGYPADMLALFGDALPAALRSVRAQELDEIAAPCDFLGVNYYTPSFVRDAPDRPPLRVRSVRWPGEYTAMDWLVYPQGFYDLLCRLAHDYPVRRLYVTENGAAYPDPAPTGGRVADPGRTRYLSEHLAAAARAVAQGVPLAGYFAWSLMDNFEWAFGYTRRFGLTFADYPTQQRTIKDSGRWYSRLIAQPPAPQP